jgi:hypothetical protein
MRHPIVHLPNQAFYLSNVFELELMTLVKMACLMANLVTLYECFTFDKDWINLDISSYWATPPLQK